MSHRYKYQLTSYYGSILTRHFTSRDNCCQPERQVIQLVINVTSDTTEIKVSVRESVGDSSVSQMVNSTQVCFVSRSQAVLELTLDPDIC